MKALLLDTHALIWWWTDDPRLSDQAREAIGDPSTTVYVSAASAWEIATKARLGRLGRLPELLPRFGELVLADAFEHLPIQYRHANRAGSYTVPHRDPFDRILAAQAELESLALVTSDPAFRVFGIPVLW